MNPNYITSSSKNYIKWVSCCLIVGILHLGCGIANNEPEIDSLDLGAYPALLNESSRTFDLTAVENSNYDYCVEFIDHTDGSSAQVYEIEAQFIDNNLENGDLSSESRIVQRYSVENFSIGINDRLSICNTMSFAVLISEFDLNREDPLENDQFMIRTFVITKDGMRLGSENSSSSISRFGVEPHFDFSITIINP